MSNMKENIAGVIRNINDDQELAWAWHCNIAMPIFDNSDVTHKEANHLASVLMKHLFNCDMHENRFYKDWKKSNNS